MIPESPKTHLRPTKGQAADSQRNSNVIRASVLETALELGFGQNSTVAHWIFNNPLSEEAEDLHLESDQRVQLDVKSDSTPYVAEAITPTLTSGSNSTDESSSLNSPGTIAHNAATVTTIQVHSHKPSVTEAPSVHFDDFSSDQLQFSPFTLSPHDAHHPGPRGNTVGKFLRDTERSRSQDDNLRHNPSPGPSDTGYTSEGQYLSKSKAGSGKEKPGKTKGSKGSRPKTPDSSKTGEKDGEYVSDGGYLSASSNKSLGKSSGKVKSRAMAFFRRRPKKSARGSDDEDEGSIPPVPAIPILPRPSSPKPLERRAAPSSPTRPGFSLLTLNLTSPPASPAKRRVSKSPPPSHVRVLHQSDQMSVSQRSTSSMAADTLAPTVLTPATTAATFPLPPSMPSTPLSSSSFPTATPPSAQLAGTPRYLTSPPSRQHLCIPPAAPPPTFPLPQLPTSSTSPSGILQLPPVPSRKAPPTRSVPVSPPIPGPTRPLTPRRAASPFRPLLSPRALPTEVSHTRMGEISNVSENDRPNSREGGRQRSGTAGLGSTPAFLQRKVQVPSLRHPPPDVPLPPSPCPTSSTRPRTPIAPPSKFHEHFSSVSSIPLQVLSTPQSTSPSLSTATLSESSSGLSLRSSHISSTSDRSEDPVARYPVNMSEYSRPTTSASVVSESSYGRPIPPTFGRSFGRSGMTLKSHFSDRSDVNSSVHSRTTHRDNGSFTTFDDDDLDVDDASPKSGADEDDDASIYPSDDQTAGRRTMYLVEHGELDENGDEVVIAGSHYWGSQEVPPPVPPLPPLPIRPGPGYF